jgi:hypothetical protein
MERPVLTEYLLKLATNQRALDRFRRSPASARKAMTDAGLTREQCDLVLKGNSRSIQAAVSREVRGLRAGLDHDPPEIEHELMLRVEVMLVTPTPP